MVATKCDCRLRIDDAEYLLNTRVHEYVEKHNEWLVIDIHFNVSVIAVHKRIREFPVEELIKGDKPCPILVHNGYNSYDWVDLSNVAGFIEAKPSFFLRERSDKGVAILKQVFPVSEDYRVLQREQLAFEKSWCELCHGKVEIGSTVQAIDEQWADGNKQQVGESGCITFTPAR